MRYEDFSFECKRLDSIKIPRNDGELKEREALLAELWRKYSWMLPPQWQATISWVIDKHKNKQLPTMTEFGAAVGMMREKGIIKTEACRSCNGIKMQYIRVRHVPTGREFEACKPCSVCMTGAEWELKKDLEVIGEGGGNSTPLRMAHAMTPQGAYWALYKANSMNVKWDPDVLVILMDKAGKYEMEIEQKRSRQSPEPKTVAQFMPNEIGRLRPSEPQGEQPAPLHDGVVSAAPDHETASAPAMVPVVPRVVTVNGEEYEIEE